MENIVVRKAKYDDISRLVEVRMQVKSSQKMRLKNLKRNMELYFREHLNKDLEVYIAERENEVIGMQCVSIVKLLPNMISPNVSSYLSYNYIKEGFDTKFLKGGFFKNILITTYNWRVDKIELDVAEENVKEYEKEGFEKSKFIPLHLLHSDINCNTSKECEITLRKAIDKDISMLVNIRMSFLNEVSPKKQKETEFQKTFSMFLEQYLNRDVEAYVAEKEGKIVACVFVVFFSILPNEVLLNGKRGVITNHYTLPAYRRKNIGHQLFAFVCKRMQEKNVEMVEMEVPKECVKLYSKFGFKVNEKVPMQYKLSEK